MHNLLEKLKSTFLRSEFSKNVATLAGSTALSQAVTVAVLPLLSRLYSPTDLGIFGLFTSFVAISSVVSSLLYEVAIVSAEDDQEAVHLVSLSLLISLTSTFLIGILSFFLIRSNILGLGILGLSSLPLLLIAIFLTSVFKILRYWLIRSTSFFVVSQVTLIQNLTRSLSQVIFGFLGFAFLGLLASDVIGRLVGMGKLLKHSSSLLKTKNFTQISSILKTALAYVKFPLLSFPSSLMDVLAVNLAIPLITEVYGSATAGFFVLAQRVLSIPLSLVGASVADVFHAKISVYAKDSPQKIKPLFLKTARNLLLVGLGPSLLITIAGGFLFQLIFGSEWQVSGLLCSIMAPWSLAALVVSPLTRIVFVFQRQEWKLLYDFLALLSLILSIFAGKIFSASAIESIIFLSAFNVFSYLIYFLLLLKMVNRASRVAI